MQTALPRPRLTQNNAVELVMYRQRRNYQAYCSHRRYRELLLLMQQAPTATPKGSL